ncbi:MAG: hypothetical protein HYX92_00125 [Chloroflexi bacterium]|nr:hypothetical protein [Chloroflexota bacterium]
MMDSHMCGKAAACANLKDLVVSGYAAYFIELPREVQDQIISRTSHRV